VGAGVGAGVGAAVVVFGPIVVVFG
jgi:hypothetical protein